MASATSLAENGSEVCVLELLTLPNELLVQILSRFNTQHLLGLTAVCRRFRDLVVRIVRSRLILAENINDRKLILECYHPTAQYTEPYLFCNYLGTSRLSGSRESSETSWKSKVKYDCLGNLGGLYSRFNPARADAISGNRNCHSTEDISKLPDRELRNGSIARTLSIESHELFSLLCVDVAIVQLGPRPGVFLSCTDILKKTTARVWRQWLAEKSTETHSSHKWREPESMIWVDSNQNVGLRVRVQERKWGRDAPILQQRDEDEAISYTLELEEIVIRSPHLLIGIEKSLSETESESGKAMIFASISVQETG